MDDETRTARELYAALFSCKELLAYTPYIEGPLPVGGDNAPMGVFGMHPIHQDGTATHVTVPMTLWGDYCGDAVQRSNYRSLLRDFPETFVDVYGDYGSSYLALPVDAAIPEHLFDELVSLAHDYPLYDEQDHSALEMELVEAAWDSYLEADIRRDLLDAGVADDSLERADLRELFNEWLSNANEYPYAESATDVVIPGLADAVTWWAENMAGERDAHYTKLGHEHMAAERAAVDATYDNLIGA
jgi:hypothetical protein